MMRKNGQFVLIFSLVFTQCLDSPYTFLEERHVCIIMFMSVHLFWVVCFFMSFIKLTGCILKPQSSCPVIFIIYMLFCALFVCYLYFMLYL